MCCCIPRRPSFVSGSLAVDWCSLAQCLRGGRVCHSPAAVESVAWVAERKDVLSGVFFMLTLWAYARYVRSKRPSSGRYTTALVFFALGLMCKPTLVTLPFVLLLLDYWPLRRVSSEEGTRVSQWSYLFLEKVPLLVFSVASCVATVLAQGRTVVSLSQLSLAQRISQSAVAYVVYLAQTVYPVRLAAIYPYPDHQNTALVIFAPLFLLVVSLLVFLCRKSYPFLLVGWLWFLGMLVPMIGIVQVGPQPHADRYTYLPQIGLFVMITWGIMSVTVARPFLRKVAIVMGAVAVVASIAISFKETASWKNSEALWREAIANTTKNQIAENNLGSVLMQHQEFDEALIHFQNAVQIYPNYPEANNNVGFSLARQGKSSEAITYYETALRFRPDFSKAHHNLGVSLAKTGKIDEAIEHFREALRMEPTNTEMHYNLASALLQIGKRDEAIAHLHEILRLNPGDNEVQEYLRQLGDQR